MLNALISTSRDAGVLTEEQVNCLVKKSPPSNIHRVLRGFGNVGLIETEISCTVGGAIEAYRSLAFRDPTLATIDLLSSTLIGSKLPCYTSQYSCSASGGAQVSILQSFSRKMGFDLSDSKYVNVAARMAPQRSPEM
jgi:hypothetical protein